MSSVTRLLRSPWALSLALLLLLPLSARASDLHCGDVLGPGNWVLETDLVCDPTAVPAALTWTCAGTPSPAG